MTDHELLESIYAELQKVKLHTRNLELSLENETNRNIRIIAEGHLDLSRKLDLCLYLMGEIFVYSKN